MRTRLRKKLFKFYQSTCVCVYALWKRREETRRSRAREPEEKERRGEKAVTVISPGLRDRTPNPTIFSSSYLPGCCECVCPPPLHFFFVLTIHPPLLTCTFHQLDYSAVVSLDSQFQHRSDKLSNFFPFLSGFLVSFLLLLYPNDVLHRYDQLFLALAAMERSRRGERRRSDRVRFGLASVNRSASERTTADCLRMSLRRCVVGLRGP